MRLAPFERRWAATVGAALLPPDALGGVRGDIDFGAALADKAALSTPGAAWALRLGLWLVWLSPLWRHGRLDGFGALQPAAQEALLEDLLDSRSYLVRELLALFKIMVCMAFVGDLRVLRHLGAYDLGPGPAGRGEVPPETLRRAGGRP